MTHDDKVLALARPADSGALVTWLRRILRRRPTLAERLSLYTMGGKA